MIRMTWGTNAMFHTGMQSSLKFPCARASWGLAAEGAEAEITFNENERRATRPVCGANTRKGTPCIATVCLAKPDAEITAD